MALFKTIEFVIEMMTSSGLDNAWNVTLITLTPFYTTFLVDCGTFRLIYEIALFTNDKRMSAT